MEREELPFRNKPAHHTVVERHNQSIIIFITVCAKDRRPILANPEMNEILCRGWNAATSFLVGRYVIMPDHIHLFCSPADIPPPHLDQWMKYWKNFSAKIWPGSKTTKLWQRNYWDTQLRTGDSYSEKWEYVRQNPVRAGLVKEHLQWPFQGELHPLRWND
ncbi:hypothetical protein BH09VER1_BH09VER1_04360 [soil metagenome]